MGMFYFPSCKAKAAHPAASERAAAYVKAGPGLEPVGCCRPNHAQLTAADTALIICNNCANIITSETEAGILTLWQLIDSDPAFPFADHSGETVSLQLCSSRYDSEQARQAVRSLLRKMRFTVRELTGPFWTKEFHAESAGFLFDADGREGHERTLHRHCDTLPHVPTVCICGYCEKGLAAGGASPLHLLELLFPSQP